MIQFNGYLASALTCNSLGGNSDMCVFSWMTLVKHLLQMDALPVMLYMPLLLLLSIMLWLVTSLLNACCLLGLHTLCIENLYSMQLISSLFDRGKIFILNEKCWCIFVWHLDQPLCMCAPHGTSTGILFFFFFFFCVYGVNFLFLGYIANQRLCTIIYLLGDSCSEMPEQFPLTQNFMLISLEH